MTSATILQFPAMTKDGPDPALPNRIRYWRKKRGLTLKEFAKLSGVSHTHIANVERGKRDLNFSTMERIAKALRVSIADLLNEDDGGLSDQERLLVETRREVPEAMRRSLDAVAESQQPFRGADELVTLRPAAGDNDPGADRNGTDHPGDGPRKRA